VGLQPRLHLDIGWADIVSIFAPLMQSRAALEARAAEPWPEHATPALSVRTAFDAVLTSLSLPKGGAVAMSAVTIQNMADVVRAHGLAPAPVDIGFATLSPDASTVDHVLASTGAGVYVHAHLYGACADLKEIVAVCRARGALLIEDCAQGYSGAPPRTASQADVSLYSFGPIKAQTCLSGAVALCRDEALAQKVRAVLAEHEPMPEQWFRVRALKYAALKLLSAPALYGLVVSGMLASGRDPDQAIGGAARGFSGADLMEALRRAPPRSLLRLLAQRTSRRGNWQWRVRCGALLDEALSATFERPGRGAPGQSFWLYPVLVEDSAAASAAMRAAGFDATRGATSLRAITDVAGVAPPNAAALIEHVLYLPIGPAISERTLKRMAEALRKNARPWRRQLVRVAA
jgi:perosamine synthetase